MKCTKAKKKFRSQEWFDNPNNNDGLLWPNKVKKYIPKWRKDNDFTAYDPNIPQPFGKNLKRIVIALSLIHI